jgi:hypothetical protein
MSLQYAAFTRISLARKIVEGPTSL